MSKSQGQDVLQVEHNKVLAYLGKSHTNNQHDDEIDDDTHEGRKVGEDDRRLPHFNSTTRRRSLLSPVACSQSVCSLSAVCCVTHTGLTGWLAVRRERHCRPPTRHRKSISLYITTIYYRLMYHAARPGDRPIARDDQSTNQSIIHPTIAQLSRYLHGTYLRRSSMMPCHTDHRTSGAREDGGQPHVCRTATTKTTTDSNTTDGCETVTQLTHAILCAT